jgi:hypothetical protein
MNDRNVLSMDSKLLSRNNPFVFRLAMPNKHF